MDSSKKRGGLEAAAELLNGLDRDHRERLLAAIAARDPEMARKLRESMCVFEDLIRVDPKELQLLVREIPPGVLPLAMRQVSTELRDQIFSAMSSRAAQALREDIDALGPRRVAEVRDAQTRIMEIARRLEGEGRLLLRASGSVP